MSNHDREWIIGCIKHDGFIKTGRFDKANHIILEALSDDAKPTMTEEVREALMRLTMCAREECDMCEHKDKCGFEFQYSISTENMNTILEALSADAVPHGRLIDADALIFELEEWKKNPNNDDSAVDLVNHFIGIIRATPSAEQVTSKLKKPCDSLLTDDSAECKEQKSKLDLISRADAIDAVMKHKMPFSIQQEVAREIDALPSADAVDVNDVTIHYKPYPSAEAESDDLIIKGAKGIKDGLYNIKDGKLYKYKAKGGTVRTYPIVPSADRPHGEWKNKEVIQNENNEIEEWQQCQCSVCGKWHTTPYMYYFNTYNYCPNCGARMEATK